MAVLKIDNFGGEFPRVQARGLPAGAAQINKNLLATSTDFRPVLGSTPVANAVNGAITLYRKQRDNSGALLSDLSEGWITDARDISYVHGQVDDDTTERTYYTYNDGATPPRMMWSGGDMQLGVPPPPKPELAVLQFDAFTATKAADWIKSTLVPVTTNVVSSLIPAATVMANQFKCRFTAPDGSTLLTGGIYGKSVAGITQLDPNQTAANAYEFFPEGSGPSYLSQRGIFEPWSLLVRIPDYLVCPEGLGNPQLGGIRVATEADAPTYIGVSAFPFWGIPDQLTLSNNLQLYTTPFGALVFTKSQADVIAREIVDRFSPTSQTVMQKRFLLDAAVTSFTKAGEKAILNRNRPTAEAALSEWKALQAAAVARMLDAQKTAGTIAAEIEALYLKTTGEINAILTTYFSSKRLARTVDYPDGLLNLDDDPLTETRFYFLTFGNSLGQESAPGPLSDQLNLTTGDLVAIKQPAVPVGRNIDKYLIYRSNSGSDSTAFQLVESVLLGATVPSPITCAGNTGVAVPGYGDKNKWRDIVANWLVYTNDPSRGMAGLASNAEYLSTAKLRIGDTVTQSGVDGYSITMRWNGHAWTMQQVPSITTTQGTVGYLDGKTGELLAEVCPTLTWLEPPVMNGKHLQGLTEMPNGVMAGFIDNTVYFCDPYHGYAWPMEYSIPIGFPIVGLRCFASTLVVGTRGNPSFITGSDSASMSEQKLDASQPCVSADSMVPALSGVFYASPDGYCFASQSGVEVVTLGLFANEDWKKLDPASIFATMHDSVLYFWFSGNGGGCYGLDTVAKKLTRHDIPATAVFDDVVTDSAYVTYNGKVRQLFSGSRATGEWESGLATLPAQAPFAWAKVYSKFEDGPVTLEWIADGVSRRTHTFSNLEPKRLPPGRYLDHVIKITSKSRVTSAMIASTTEELKAV